jgi:hypothetical protein
MISSIKNDVQNMTRMIIIINNDKNHIWSRSFIIIVGMDCIIKNAKNM